jgi:hypothetical protein
MYTHDATGPSITANERITRKNSGLGEKTRSNQHAVGRFWKQHISQRGNRISHGFVVLYFSNIRCIIIPNLQPIPTGQFLVRCENSFRKITNKHYMTRLKIFTIFYAHNVWTWCLRWQVKKFTSQITSDCLKTIGQSNRRRFRTILRPRTCFTEMVKRNLFGIIQLHFILILE